MRLFNRKMTRMPMVLWRDSSWMFSLEGGLPSEFIERMDMLRGRPGDCRVICAAVGLT